MLPVTGFAGPQRLRQLLDAVMAVASELDLPTVLRRITQSAVDLVDARYGALGVLDETGTRLAEFITVSLGGNGSITHVINDTGGTAQGTATVPVNLVSYP